MPTPTEPLADLVNAFEKSPYADRAGVDAQLALALLNVRASDLGEDDPGVWSRGSVHELIAHAVPEVLPDDGNLIERAPATLRALLSFLGETGRLQPASRSLRKLLSELDDSIPEFVDAVTEPDRDVVAATLVQAMLADDLDVTDQAAVRRWVEDFMERPPEEQRKIVESALAAPNHPYDDALVDDLFGEEGFLAQARRRLLDDEPIGPGMPPVLVPPEDQLADAARESRTFKRLLALVAWVGPSRRITGLGTPSLAAAKQAVAALGLGEDPAVAATLQDLRDPWDVSPLMHLWRTATYAELLTTHPGRVVPGPELRPATDEDVLDRWLAAFEACVDGEDVDEDYEPPLFEDLIEMLPSMLGALYAERAPLPVASLPAQYEEGDQADLDPAVVRDRVEEIFGRLADLGAVRWHGAAHDPGRTVELTDLGVYGVREQLRGAGIPAPLVGELVDASAATLLAGAGNFPVEDFHAEVDAWLARRDPGPAAHELAEAARGAESSAELRAMAFAALGRVPVEVADPAARELLDDRLAGPHARMWLTVHGRPGPGLARGDQAILFLDAAATLIDNEDEDAIAEELANLTTAQGGLAMVESMWRVDHPNVLEVLDVLGEHPDRRLAKTARKAAFRARSR